MTNIQTLYAALMAFGFLIGISVAFTLVIELAGALYMRDQIRLLIERIERSNPPSPTRTSSTGAAQLPIPTEDERVLVLR